METQAIFKKMTQHFPRWMDIRKRSNSSDGGLLLQSVAEEFEHINAAVQEYKDDYFLVRLIGREDEIVDYLWAAHVGTVENITLTAPAVAITTSEQSFLSNRSSLCLYTEGYLLFTKETIGTLEKTSYIIDSEYAYSTAVEKVHIWNLFDEFAMFSGLERRKDETNKELTRRTLLIHSRPANSSEPGLKNAILNSLPDGALLAKESIVFDTDGSSALTTPDAEFGTLYERLSRINKDTWRTKEWRKSDWEHAFKELEYLPNVWDATPALYQNGTGKNDDLKVGFTSELGNDTTDVNVFVYERSNVRIQDYVRNNTIEETIPMTLTQYSDELTAKDVQFKIEASEAVDILNEDIQLESRKQAYGQSDHFIEDILLYAGDTENFTVSDPGKLTAGTEYKLQFRPQSGFDAMKIINCSLDGNSILTEKAPYSFVNGVLVNTDVLLHQESIGEMKGTTNLKDVLEGFTVSDTTFAGKAIVDISNIGEQYVTVKSSCRKTAITNSGEFVTARGFVMQEDGSLLSQEDVDFCDITIDGNMSDLSFVLVEGACLVAKTVGGITTTESIYEAGSYEYNFGNATDVTLKITRMGASPLRIRNIAYASYRVDLSLKKGELRVLPGLGIVLPPAQDDNDLYIDIQSFSSFAPVISYVHIGSDLSNSIYEISFTTTAAASLQVDSNCDITLFNTTNGTAVESYVTKKTYTNNTEQTLSLRLDTGVFTNIEASAPEILTQSYGGETTRYILVSPGEAVQKVAITGTSTGRKQIVRLVDIIDTTGCTQLYASKAVNGIIKRTAAGDTLISISRDMLHPDADYFCISCPDSLGWAFIMPDGSRVFDKDCDRNFNSLALFPKTANEYVAYNNTTMVQEDQKDLAIVELFHPPLPTAGLLVWKIAEQSEGASVLFSYQEPRNWSVSKHAVNVTLDMSMDNEQSYNRTITNITPSFTVNDTIQLEPIVFAGGRQYELAKYVISVPSWLELIYEVTEHAETIIAESDGFNKLAFANVREIISVTGCSPADLELMAESGIIRWLNPALYGQSITVRYSYNNPVSMSYLDMDHLYSLAGYSVDAYSLAEGYPKSYLDVTDGVVIPVTDSSKCKLVARCTNANFGYAVETEGIRIIKTNKDNLVYIHGGYYYENGNEHYLYASQSADHFENLGKVSLNDIDRIDNQLILHQQSTNFLDNSSMTAGRKAEACIVDFVRHEEIKGVSALENITACDSFAGWQIFGMKIEYVPSLNGLGMRFTKEHAHGYAFLEITEKAVAGKVLSLWHSGSLVPALAFEKLIGGESLGAKAAALSDITPMEAIGSYYAHTFEEPAGRVYLLINGEGTVDDIIITDSVTSPDGLHRRVSTRFGFNVEERADTGAVETFVIERTGNRYNKADMASDRTVMTSTNADWGFTKIYELRNDFSGCITDLNRMAGFISGETAGFVTTPRFYIPNRENVRRLVVKINDLHTAEITRISCYAANEIDEEAYAISSVTGANMLQINGLNLLNYLEIKVDIPAGAVIESIEAYVEYAESKSQTLYIAPQNYGEMETKLYDIGYSGKLMASNVAIIGEARELSQIVLQVRGCRKTDEEIVWTEWKQIRFNENGSITNAPVFDGYQFFCFKISLYTAAASILIDRIEFEVID